MNLNQFTIIGYLGKNADTKYLPNGNPVTKFSVATKKSWKDENNEWKSKTQWHNVVAFGKSFEQLGDRLVKGAHVFVQGELTTREYPRTITTQTDKKLTEHTVAQLVWNSRPTPCVSWTEPIRTTNPMMPPSRSKTGPLKGPPPQSG